MPVNNVGRPTLPFDLCAPRTQTNKIADLSQVLTVEKIRALAKKILKSEHNLAGMKMIDEIFDKKSAEHLFEMTGKPESSSMSPEEGLMYLIQNNMTREMYQNTRKTALDKGHKLFPSYKQVYKAKLATYLEEIFISETLCKVPLKNLLDHTAKRLMMALNLNILGENRQLKLILKYGFDGTNAKTYKQKADDSSAFCDHMFCTSLLPLQLVDTTEDIVHWTNPLPSSTRFCRPIKISFEKETAELARNEEKNLQEEINTLRPLVYENCFISFEMHLTMIDGKICSALNDVSSQKCHLCEATISQFNDIYNMYQLTIVPKALKYGISILHAHIRFMELVLHMSYRIGVKGTEVPKVRFGQMSIILRKF
ncbi:hypothetical protein TKK_0002981 [Trichogramma kaykai]